MKTRIELPAQPKSMRPIIDATQREQRHGSAYNWCMSRDGAQTKLPPNDFATLTV